MARRDISTTRPLKSLFEIARQPVWHVSEAALVLRLSETNIRSQLRQGTITGIRVARKWRIPASQFQELARALQPPDGDSGDQAVRVPCATHHHLPTCTPSLAALETSRPTLRIFLLGRPQVYMDEIRVAELERSNRRSQVLQLLALHRAGLSGSQLASSLNMATHQFEEETLTSHYVRNLVWATRRQARKNAGWDGIIESPTNRGAGLHHYKLPDNTICDLWEFEDKLDEADRLMVSAVGLSMPHDERTMSIERTATLREEALQLYRGEFCEGSNNGLVAQAAHMLRERYIHSALQQGDYWRARALHARGMRWQDPHHVQHGQNVRDTHDIQIVPLDPMTGSAQPEEGMAWREALRNYERVLTTDNYHEEAYVHAMESYAHLGNARGVGLMFTRCQDVLHADLMQPPGEEVVRAYKECKAVLGVSPAD